MDCSTPGFSVLHYLLEFAQTHVHWINDAIQPSHLSLPSPPALSLSQHQGLFQWVALRIRWPKYWRFNFSLSPSNEYSGLISFRMDWLDLLAVQGTLKNLLQHHSLKASILWHSAFFMVQLSHPFMTIGKTIALTRWLFVSNWTMIKYNLPEVSVTRVNLGSVMPKLVSLTTMHTASPTIAASRGWRQKTWTQRRERNSQSVYDVRPLTHKPHTLLFSSCFFLTRTNIAR